MAAGALPAAYVPYRSAARFRNRRSRETKVKTRNTGLQDKSALAAEQMPEVPYPGHDRSEWHSLDLRKVPASMGSAVSKLAIIEREHSEPSDFFARQELIGWWDQAAISGAKVMVAGAGALGNETIKNLMLLGFGNLLICDFDQIEDSNLSRTVLFRKEDIGKPKARAAAERAHELALVEHPRIEWFHGDITTGLGLAVFEQLDVVLGCVDNIEARIYINACCRRVGTPWIDSGINELSGHVMAFAPTQDICYECGLSSHQYDMARQRYACGQVKRKYFEAGKIPTVQVTSSIIAGVLTQECLKLLCNAGPAIAKRLHFRGFNNDLECYNLTRRSDCTAHVSLPPVENVDLTSQAKLSELLATAERQCGHPVVLQCDLLYKGFARSGLCSLCDRRIEFLKPMHSLFDIDLFCTEHTVTEINNCKKLREPDDILSLFSLKETEPRILELSLAQLGIPTAHIITFRRADGIEFGVRMVGDLPSRFPMLISETAYPATANAV